MKKTNYAETIIIVVMACILCGGMLNVFAADVPYGTKKLPEEALESELVELHNPILDKETGDVTFSYIEFGSYPQSEVTGGSLTNDIIKAEYVNGETIVNGVKYRRVAMPKHVATKQAATEQTVIEQAATGESVTEQNRYFKYEPIRWRLVYAQGGKAILRTDKILDYKIYDAAYEVTGRYSKNWKDSVLQHWLNGYEQQENCSSFLQVSFSEQDLECIIATELEYDAVDMVYILDWDEWVDWNFIFEAADQVNAAVKSDFANLFSPNPNEQTGAWWLRKSPGEPYWGITSYYNANGQLCNQWFSHNSNIESKPELFKAYKDNTEIGVCPAVTVDLSKLGFYVKEAEGSEVPATKEPIGSTNPISSGMLGISEKPMISGIIDGSEQPTSAPIGSPEVSHMPLSSEAVVKGDLDINGKVNLSDAQLALKAALKVLILDEAGQKAADVDDDGKITLADAQNILKLALNIIEKI